ncbi:MAG: STT3 domain-containing protein [Candidatus Omnitrophica bacterium]|nr:STT3 domain-containing protein [Candidatus Omnitrophota bacterium]
MRRILIISKSVLLFSFILSVSFLLRMTPSKSYALEFVSDSAFNYRMTESVIQKGSVPIIDRLSIYPEGKNIRNFLPVGLYYAGAAFHRFLNVFRQIPLNESLLIFAAFFSSLICVPVYFLSLEIYRNKKVIAFLSAFLSAIIPAYLHRTFCYMYRYEVLAVPLLFMSLLFFIMAFGEKNGKPRLIYYFGASLFCLMLASWVWRLYALFLIAYLIIIVYLCFKRRDLLGNERMKIIISGAGILLLFSAFSLIQTPAYSGLLHFWTFLEILMQRLYLPYDFSQFSRVIYYVNELSGVSILGLSGANFLSLSGIFAIFYLYACFRKQFNPQKFILQFFIILFLALTLFFSRLKIILGPLIALSLGESLIFIFYNHRGVIKKILLGLLVIIFIKTGCDAWRLASTRFKYAGMDAELKQSILAVNRLTSENSVILCDWGQGYSIQTYCNRPTITDGLLESPEIIKRIITVAKIFSSYDEEALWFFCKEYGVTHILVAKRPDYAFAYSQYSNRSFTMGKGANGKDAPLIYKLFYRSPDLKRIDFLYENKGFILYALKH